MPASVCHVCSGHPADDARVFDRECMSLAQAGYETHLFARTAAPRPFVREGVTIHPVPPFPSRRARMLAARSIARHAAALNPDVFHVHEPELLWPVLAAAGDRPVIWDVHEALVSEIRSKAWIPAPLRPLVERVWDRVERTLVRRCAAIVPVSEGVADRYRALHDRVVVVANFPRQRHWAARPAADRRPKALVFTGSIAPDRGLSDVIQAMRLLAQRSVDVVLELAGEPVSRRYLDLLLGEADRAGVRDRIRWHGQLPLEEALRLQQACGIGLLVHHPSGGSLFGYPVKMFEFMMNGLPLVYSRLPTFTSILDGRDAGIAVDPHSPRDVADAVERLLGDPALSRRLGDNGRKAVADSFNWDREWPRLLDLYRHLAEAPRGTPPVA